MEFISFREIYHHIAFSVTIIIGALWSEAIKNKLSTISYFKGINGNFLQSLIITLFLLLLLIFFYFILNTLQNKEEAIIKKVNEKEDFKIKTD
jgi:hypothetical protein|tara:strand:- start:4461 stop:4739 length:279 start_codon:yes stop_codon:yes gene_type:complete